MLIIYNRMFSISESSSVFFVYCRLILVLWMLYSDAIVCDNEAELSRAFVPAQMSSSFGASRRKHRGKEHASRELLRTEKFQDWKYIKYHKNCLIGELMLG